MITAHSKLIIYGLCWLCSESLRCDLFRLLADLNYARRTPLQARSPVILHSRTRFVARAPIGKTHDREEHACTRQTSTRA